MTPERFHELIDAYGGDPKRWPAAERAAALAYAERDADARAALDEALKLDALLDGMKLTPPAIDTARLVAAAARAAQERPESQTNVVPFAPRRGAARPIAAWARAGALAAAAVCGFVIGMNDPSVSAGASALELIDSAQMEDTAW